MDNGKLMGFTIVDIIERKIEFTNKNTIFDKKEFKDYDDGVLLAYKEMLVDVKGMGEDEFTYKYIKIIKRIGKQFDNNEIMDSKEIERMSGYNNAIVSILILINPIYEYYLEEDD